jgi:hypothetical protein
VARNPRKQSAHTQVALTAIAEIDYHEKKKTEALQRRQKALAGMYRDGLEPKEIEEITGKRVSTTTIWAGIREHNVPRHNKTARREPIRQSTATTEETR